MRRAEMGLGAAVVLVAGGEGGRGDGGADGVNGEVGRMAGGADGGADGETGRGDGGAGRRVEGGAGGMNGGAGQMAGGAGGGADGETGRGDGGGGADDGAGRAGGGVAGGASGGDGCVDGGGAADNEGDGADGEAGGECAIGDFVDDARVVIDLDVSSRKRLFERLAEVMARPGAAEEWPDSDTVLGALTRREKLGCTGIGGGIALPHGRIDGFAEPVVAVARLARAVEYDAPDQAPVWLAVALLAPTAASELHLQLLAALARRFSAPCFVAALKRADSAAELAAEFRRA